MTLNQEPILDGPHVLDLEPVQAKTKLPRGAIGLVWLITLLPAALMIIGVDFGSEAVGIDHQALGVLPINESTDAIFHSLSGAFAHVILEWSAVLAALFACLLCFTAWTFRRNATLPIMGVALLCAGTMDAFHTLAATRLIEASADNRQLIPFTWALARVFDIAIVAIGVLISSRSKQYSWAFQKRFVLATASAFAVAAYVTIHICASRPDLPKTMFPDALITRPWDVAPLVLWILAALFVLRPFHKRETSVFSHALLLSVVPQVATEIHMAFGSTRLFDAGFNVAHFLKIVGYAVPAAGLLIEYAWTLAAQKVQVQELQEVEEQLLREKLALSNANEDLSLRNVELDEFAHVASHDLQEPLRKLVAFSDLLKVDAGSDLSEDAVSDLGFITDAANRMSALVEDILLLSRSGRLEANPEEIPLEKMVHDILMAMELGSGASAPKIEIDSMPSLHSDITVVRQVLQNLISNALKYTQADEVRVRISAEQTPDKLIISVEDNGIGIAPEYRDVIFAPFKRLHGRGEYGGTGIGLAICRRSLSRLGGTIWVEDSPFGGCCFKFSVPMVPNTASNTAVS